MIGALIVLGDWHVQHRLHHGRWLGWQSGQGGQSREQEQDGTDQRGDRIARQSQYRHSPEPSKHQRLARPHRNPPEIHFQPALLERRDDQVVVADARAARGHQHVHSGHGISHSADRRAVIAGDWKHGRRAARSPHQRRQSVAVRAYDATWWDGLAGQRDLIARRENSDAWPTPNRKPGVIGGGSQTNIPRRDPSPGWNDRVACREVLPGAADMAAGTHRLVYPHGLAVPCRVLLQQNPIRAAGNHAAGEQPHCLSGAHCTNEGMAGRCAADDPKHGPFHPVRRP